jgi:hypothetical protein
MAGGAFEYDAISYNVPVTIGPKIRVLHGGHVCVCKDGCSSIQGTCDLVNYILNCVSITEYPAFVDVAANKKDFRNNRIQVFPQADGIDCDYLRDSQFSNTNGMDLLAIPNSLQVGAQQIMCVGIERHYE